MNSFNITPIGIVLSPYKQKFGIPRQCGIISEAKIKIILNKEFTQHSVRGLHEFEYIWLQYIFHKNIQDGWSQLVRPPKLGGKTKKGVFATRSPHRPNFIGLSLLKLEKIELFNKNIQLFCSGADILDQTPVIDIKPYLSHFESKQNIRNNFSLIHEKLLSIVWNEKEKEKIQDTITLNLIEKSLIQDPRPAYQKIEERVYITQIENYEIYFQIIQQTVHIIKIKILI